MKGPLYDIWRRLNAEILRRAGPERYACWIRHARPALLDEDLFTFHFSTTDARDKVEALLKDLVTQAAQRVTNRKVRVRFQVERASFPLSPPPDEDAPADGTFASFVAGPGNRMALEAARAFARGGPRAPALLFLHGGPGLGKTHLLRAVARELTVRPALHFTGEQFVRHFQWAYHRDHLQAFLAKCRTAGALLFDDVHLLAGKEAAQAALADVLGALSDRGARAVLTSDRPVRALEGFARPLRARLRSAEEAVLERPDPATGLAILRRRAPRGVPDAALEVLASLVRTSYADQLRCLRRPLEIDPPSPAAARAVASEFLNEWSLGLTYTDIVRAAAETFGVKVTEIYAPGRSRAACEARQACFYLARKLLGRPFAQIGEHFGGRGHATVLEACRKIERRNGPARERLRRLEEKLQAASPAFTSL